MSFKVRLALFTLFAALATALIAGCSSSDDDDDTVKIGALLPLTGTLATYGETSEAVLNDLLGTLNEDSDTVELVIEDTESNPQTALSKLQEMYADGIVIVIGPYSSSEVQAVRQFADANGIILISPLSTATSLAASDNIFRFTPDDNFEGIAVAALAYADNMRTIIAVSRNDPGNLGLQSGFKAAFEKLGGKVVPGITYAPNETDFTDEMRTLSGIIASNVTGNSGNGNVGVLLTAFGEVGQLLGAASDVGGDALNGVAWYGSDSVAQSKDLVANAKASAFAFGAGYPNPILGLRDADKAAWGPVIERVTREIGRTPDAFALAAYDGLDVAVQVMQNADDDVQARKAELISLTNSATGLTGPLRLNEAGDRAIGIYDFWSVCLKNNAWTWYRSATYNPTDGAKQLGPC